VARERRGFKLVDSVGTSLALPDGVRDAEGEARRLIARGQAEPPRVDAAVFAGELGRAGPGRGWLAEPGLVQLRRVNDD
jgi:hypothetical protein